MRVLFYCHNFTLKNARLMPWRYIYEIAYGLKVSGHEITVLSEGQQNDDKWQVHELEVRAVGSGGLFSNQNLALMNDADYIVWSASPLTPILKSRLSGINSKIILLYTGPFYRIAEIIRAQRCSVPFKQLLTHYKNAVVPLSLTVNLINSDAIVRTVALSNKNAAILKRAGTRVKKITVIPPGHNSENMEVTSMSELRKKLNLPGPAKILSYMGSLYEIRGVALLIEAFKLVSLQNENLILLILARTDNSADIVQLKHRIAELGVESKLIVIPGLLPPDTVKEYVLASDVVVLPFVLVPSDMPLGALEAMAMGKPVISTDIDGMPEMIEGRGGVVPPGNVKALAKAMAALCSDQDLYDRSRNECIKFMQTYPSWDVVADSFNNLLVPNA